MAWPLTALEACEIISKAYDAPGALDIEIEIDVAGIQAAIVRRQGKHIYLIQGTNERSDWFRFNFDFLPSNRRGDTRDWHGGFLRHGEFAYGFAKGKAIDVVIGHSLGAAAAQIVGISLGVPTIGIASPRPLHDDRQPEHARKVANLCRTDDLVCQLPPPFLGYRHVGDVHWFDPAMRHIGEDHRIDKYIDIIKAQGDPLA